MINLELPHRRFNPLTQEWVLVSPHRARRPWLGQVEKMPPENLPAYDPSCYLCPGNTRANGKHNPVYESTFVFANDFPALLRPGQVPDEQDTDAPGLSFEAGGSEIFRVLPEHGIARVVCFSPRHDLTLPELDQAQVEAVVRTWSEQTSGFSKQDFIAYVQVFENKGAMMGCSNPHPHSQIWATSLVPNEPAKEIQALANYQQRKGSCMLCDYLAEEQGRGERLVAANAYFSALVPFWAIWPFEIILLSHRHVGSLPELTRDEVSGLADILRRVTARYDNLFEISFPYSMGFHQSPLDREAYPQCHLHAHFYPPLLRSATVRKFMVGYEMLAMPQRDLTPESAALRLRSLSETHYRQTSISDPLPEGPN